MSRQTKCDRCGAVHPAISPPAGWVTEILKNTQEPCYREHRDLCPKCAAEWKDINGKLHDEYLAKRDAAAKEFNVLVSMPHDEESSD